MGRVNLVSTGKVLWLIFDGVGRDARWKHQRVGERNTLQIGPHCQLQQLEEIDSLNCHQYLKFPTALWWDVGKGCLLGYLLLGVCGTSTEENIDAGHKRSGPGKYRTSVLYRRVHRIEAFTT